MTRAERASAQLLALALARQHPGWGCRRIAAAMSREGVHASKTAVAAWIRDAGLAPANRQLRKGDWPRRQAVVGVCGHPLAPPPLDEPTRRVLCFQCGWVEVSRRDRRELVARAEQRKAVATAVSPVPDTRPTRAEHDLHFVDRRVSTVAQDLLDRIRYGRGPAAQVRAELRRSGLSDEEIDRVLGLPRGDSRKNGPSRPRRK